MFNGVVITGHVQLNWPMGASSNLVGAIARIGFDYLATWQQQFLPLRHAPTNAIDVLLLYPER